MQRALLPNLSQSYKIINALDAWNAAGGRSAVGDFDPLPTASFDLFDTQSDGCASVDPGASGKLALINRGTCTFSQKVANAKAAGAIAVIIINNVAGDPTAMARTAGFGNDLHRG